ncbi:hypothetical protein [Streptomyces angustmyceticus]|uniref:Uncharacterized protein n=1 Tax=Streptomyces angustmyceticus TaxID=285578 RepID=A0A5J4LQ91_9ACTN|nr:hypothetical protein San01_66500 [Streptomyces angustmyceticus]
MDEISFRLAGDGADLRRLVDLGMRQHRPTGSGRGAGYTVVGEQPAKEGDDGSRYAVTLLEKRLGA